jgi:hypothetical protein
MQEDAFEIGQGNLEDDFINKHLSLNIDLFLLKICHKTK